MAEIEDRWRDLGAFIREQRRVGQLSLRKLSEMAGISNPYLSQIERGLRKPSAEILRNIAGALSISAETLYVRAGILDERDGDHDLVADIRRDPTIDEEQKKTLVHIYLSFRAAHLAGGGGPPEIDGSADEELPARALGPGPEPDHLDDPDDPDPDDPDPDDPDPDDPDPDDPDPDDPDRVADVGSQPDPDPGPVPVGAAPVGDGEPPAAVDGAPEPGRDAGAAAAVEPDRSR